MPYQNKSIKLRQNINKGFKRTNEAAKFLEIGYEERFGEFHNFDALILFSPGYICLIIEGIGRMAIN